MIRRAAGHSLRKTQRSSRGFALLLFCCAACHGREPEPRETKATLSHGVMAEVGADAIALETVVRVAHAQHVDLAVARERAIRDALFAAAARDRMPQMTANGVVSAALARALLEDLAERARASGPPTDDEVAAISRERWYEFDRPETVRVTHVVVRVKDVAQRAAARALAERIQDAVRNVHEADGFRKRAREVPADGFEVIVERLPPTTADGRTFDPDHRLPPGAAPPQLEESFARAAHAIGQTGSQSPIVETSYGYHVILLEERLPERIVPLEQRRIALENEIWSRRAAAAERELLDRLQQTARIEVDRAFEDLTSRLQISQ